MTVANRSRGSLPRVAIVGCGAAAREFCLPVLVEYAGYKNSIVIVDKSRSQAEAVAKEFGIQHYCTDYQSLPTEVDAAVITTPHDLHAEQSIHFLQQGKPVFVEKPLGMTAAQTADMLRAAATGGATLMVNNCRRLFPAYRRVGEMLRSGGCGRILRISISDGSPFEWQSVSSFYLRSGGACKGVFLDRGAHTVDILCSWLPAIPKIVEARQDAAGGAEALMDVRLDCNGTAIDLKFSRLFKLENCYSIECERMRLQGRLFAPAEFNALSNGRVQRIKAGRPAAYHVYARRLVENFLGVVAGREQPLFLAEDVAPSIAVIEEAYRQAVPFKTTWYDEDPNIAWLRSDFHGN